MNDRSDTWEQLDESTNKRFIAIISLESGCNFDEGEYTLDICPMGGYIGEEDFNLVQECIDNHLTAKMLPEEGMVSVIVQETGEWEDVFWHKYYRILGYIIESKICEITKYEEK